MTELRRVTTTPVDWGFLDGGKVIAVSTRRDNRCINSECKVLLYTASGAMITSVVLADGVDRVVDAAVNSANVVVCCAVRRAGQSQKTALAFVYGSQVLKLQEVSYWNGTNEERSYSVLCLCIGGRDVAVYGLGSGKLFLCVREGNACTVGILWDFGEAVITRVAHGRRSFEVVVLLNDGSFALVVLYEAEDGSIIGSLACHEQKAFSAVPVQAVFAGGLMLWVLCNDYSLYGYWFPPPAHEDACAPLLLHKEEPFFSSWSENLKKVLMIGEHRSCGVHVLFQTPTTVHFRTRAAHSFDGPSRPPTLSAGWTHGMLLWGGFIHCLSMRQCAYELLVQNELGASQLSVLTLRQNSSLFTFEESQGRPLGHQILGAAPEKLEAMREQCEQCVQKLEEAAATVQDKESTEEALLRLVEIQDNLVAILHRERELIKRVLPHQSISFYFIERLRTVYIRLLVYRLLYSTGFGANFDIPLRDFLGLERARYVLAECQADLRVQLERELDLTHASTLEILSVLGSRDKLPFLCIDIILAHIGCSAISSLRDVIQQMTKISPAIVLLVLYCGYAGQLRHEKELQASNAEEEGDASAVLRHYPPFDSICEDFLNSFSLPFFMSQWAYLSFAADNCLKPSDVSTVQGLGCPPMLDLIPGIINGLTYSGAYELVFQLTGLVLTVSTAKDMDASVALKLLFLAYKRGNATVLDTLYWRVRGSPCGAVATQLVASAALKMGSVKILSGLIAPQSSEEDIVESVLRRCPDAGKSDFLLIEFYVLMQRYAEALIMCDQLVSRHSVDAQRVQVIVSHLRSLLPNGNTSYRLQQKELQENGDYLRLPNVTSCFQQLSRSDCLFRVSFLAVPTCPLQSEEEELHEAVDRTTARICAWQHNGGLPAAVGSGLRRETNTIPFSPTPAALLGISYDRLRRGSCSDAGSSTKQRDQQPLQRDEQRQLEMSQSDMKDSDSVEITNASLVTQPPRPPALLLPETGPLYCEAIIRRSKKPCGRKRPCEYHDRGLR